MKLRRKTSRDSHFYVLPTPTQMRRWMLGTRVSVKKPQGRASPALRGARTRARLAANRQAQGRFMQGLQNMNNKLRATVTTQRIFRGSKVRNTLKRNKAAREGHPNKMRYNIANGLLQEYGNKISNVNRAFIAKLNAANRAKLAEKYKW